MADRWSGSGAPKGDAYDEQWRRLEAAGKQIHGEVHFLLSLEPAPASVLDAGCGTGRIAVELARRGVRAVGVDVDAQMLVAARAKAPELTWHEADLATLDLGERFACVVLAGNVLLFVAPGTEAAVVARCAAHVEPGGALVAGFQLGRGYALEDLDAHARDCGLALEARFATWERAPFEGGDYAVSVFRARSDIG